jgi:glycosyltransferase involved in cell wall biosynthesis
MTLKKPSISIAMVTYNHEKYVAEAIQSILNQTFTDFELIIVNDGSTDKTEDIIKSFDDSRITYIYQKNQGPSTATNTAILASEGKYLALMSGDDSCNPERLEKQYQFLSSSPEHKIVFSHVDFINENSRPMASEWGENTFNHPNFKSRAELLRHFFFLGNCLNAVTCMLERKIVLEAGLFNVASIQLQDYDMWLKLVKKYDFHVLPAKLIKYRIRDADSNLSSTTHSVRSCFEHYVIAKNLFDDVSISLFKTAFSDHLIHKNFTTEIEYELEKAFLYLKNEIPLLSMIGTQKLFYLLQDKETLNISRNQYKFDLPDLYKLMAIADISKSVKLNEIKQLLDQSRVQLNEIKQLLDQSRAQLDAVLHSTSWSITKPLRFFNIHLNVNSMQKIIVTLKNAVFFPFRLIKYYGGPIPLFKKMMQVIARERLSIFRRIFKHSKKLIQHINNSSSCYDSWYKSQLTNRCLVAQNDSIQLLRANQKPKISIVIPVCDPSLEHLKKALDSVLHQYYQNWELCIADDCSSNEAVKNTLREYAARDSRIKTAFRSERGHISEALNSGLELATGDYIGFLDHDDELERDALYWVAKTIIENPTAKFIYSDEDKISPQGTLERPYFKPDWNKDLLLSQNYICHLLVLEKNLLSRLGGFNSLYNGSQDYDLVLRASELCDESEIKHIPLVLYHWREHAGSTAMNIGAKPYAVTAGLRAVTDHLKRLGIAATVAPAPAAPFWSALSYPHAIDVTF